MTSTVFRLTSSAQVTCSPLVSAAAPQLRVVACLSSSDIPFSSVTCRLLWRPRRPKTAFAVAFLNFVGPEESPMIHKLGTLGIPAILSLVFTTRSEEHISLYGPAKTRTKMKHILLFPVGKGEAPFSPSSFHLIDCARRLLGFLACLAGAAVCFGIGFFTLPLLAIRPAKFALSFRHVHDNSACALHC